MEILNILNDRLKDSKVFFEANMKNFTSLRIGGPAKYLVNVASIYDIKECIKIAKEYDLALIAVGNGSNILVSDNGINAIVLRISKEFSNITKSGTNIYADAGASMAAIATFAQENSLSGLSFASGIPGTIGGGVVMNAGAYGGELKDVVCYVDFIDENLNIIRYTNEDMNFDYRHSALQNTNNIVIGVGFSLEYGEIESIKNYTKELNRKRAEKQPLDKPSCGSTFKRPKGNFAAALIEEAGLKGFSLGSCSVSSKHAGFLVNDNNCTAKEYMDLINYVKKTVYEKTGYTLELEVRKLGEF